MEKSNYTPVREAMYGLISRVQEIKQDFADILRMNAEADTFMDAPECDIVDLAINDTLMALVWAHGALMRREFLDDCPPAAIEAQRAIRAEYIKNLAGDE